MERSRQAGMQDLPPPWLRRRSIPLTVVLLVALVAAGCSRIVGPRTFTVSAELAGGATWTLQVTDNSGRVTNLELDPGPAINGPSDAAFNDPVASNRLVIPWTGGACDRATTFTVDADAGGRVTIAFGTSVAPGACDLVGIGHQLVLETDPALPASLVTLTRLP